MIKKYCTECGTKIETSDKYCSKCGKSLQDGTSKHSVYEKKDIEKNLNTSTDQSYEDVVDLTAPSILRFINFIIDLTTIIIINVIIGIIIVNTSTNPYVDSSNYDWLYYVVLFFYYFILEAFFGKTLGKLVTNTTVVNLKLERLDFSNIFVRTISRFMPFDAFSNYKNGTSFWHDRWSKTIVVKDSSLNH